MAKKRKLVDQEIFVEKIVDSRVKNGNTEYLIKMKGADNTQWEPEGNLDCPVLIKKFKETKKEPAIKKEERCTCITEEQEKKLHQVKKKKVTEKYKPWGFDMGIEPERILNAFSVGGEVIFLMKWKGIEKPEVVSARDANKKCPKVVIRFYEERVRFYPPSSSDSD